MISASVSPVYKECVQRGYQLEEDFEQGISYCIFPDNSKCLIEDFNNGVCGQEFMTEDYCIEEGIMV